VHSASPQSGLPYDQLLEFLRETKPPLKTPLDAVRPVS
jgi:hypothetical protein